MGPFQVNRPVLSCPIPSHPILPYPILPNLPHIYGHSRAPAEAAARAVAFAAPSPALCYPCAADSRRDLGLATSSPPCVIGLPEERARPWNFPTSPSPGPAPARHPQTRGLCPGWPPADLVPCKKKKNPGRRRPAAGECQAPARCLFTEVNAGSLFGNKASTSGPRAPLTCCGRCRVRCSWPGLAAIPGGWEGSKRPHLTQPPQRGSRPGFLRAEQQG